MKKRVLIALSGFLVLLTFVIVERQFPILSDHTANLRFGQQIMVGIVLGEIPLLFIGMKLFFFDWWLGSTKKSYIALGATLGYMAIILAVGFGHVLPK